MSKYIIGATSDIGPEREIQEDYVDYKELDDNNLLAIIADGSASRKEIPQPAAIVTTEIIDYIAELFDKHPDYLLEDPSYFLKAAFIHANRVLNAFKLGNDEIYGGFAASITACLFTEDGYVFFAHCGNTRFCVIRGNRMIQATDDYTVGNEKLKSGEITEDAYYVSMYRLQVTSALGMMATPEIQTGRVKVKKGDVYLLTTDGIHFAIQPEYIQDIVLNSQDAVDASRSLMEASRDVVKYPDNMTALVAYMVIDDEDEDE